MMPSFHRHLTNAKMFAKLHTLVLTEAERKVLAAAESDMATRGRITVPMLNRLRRLLRAHEPVKRVEAAVDKLGKGRLSVRFAELPVAARNAAGAAAFDAMVAGSARDALRRRTG